LSATSAEKHLNSKSSLTGLLMAGTSCAAAVKAEDNEEAELWGGGEYHCAAAYPSPPCSMQLGRQNLHLFRLKNTRFDVIGGIFYFCLVVSLLLLLSNSVNLYIGAFNHCSLLVSLLLTPSGVRCTSV